MEHPLHEAPSHRLSALRCWEFGVPGLAPQDRGLGFRALGFRVLGFRVLGFRISGLGYIAILVPLHSTC